MPKFNEWLSSLLRNKEKLKEIAITTVNAKCSAINMNKVPEKLKDLGKFLIPCALQELDRTNVKIKNSNVSDEPVLLNTPLSDKVKCFAPEDDNDEIDAFLAIDDASHNLASEVISDHEPEQNESSITFSPRSDPLNHEFAGELLTLPSRNDHEFGEYLSLMTVLYEISTSQSQENVHANQSSVIESLPVSPIPVEDSEPTQEEINIFLIPDNLIPLGVEHDDSEDEHNELPNLDHQDDPSIPRPPPEPPDVEKCFEPEVGLNQQFSEDSRVRCFVPVHSSFLAFA
ncbi:hypothetical protein Tco_0519567 [Tanacetum coccineum]